MKKYLWKVEELELKLKEHVLKKRVLKELYEELATAS
jgi:hypothetical protein